MALTREDNMALPTREEVKKALEWLDGNRGCKENETLFVLAQAYADGELVEPMTEEELIKIVAELYNKMPDSVGGKTGQAVYVAWGLVGKVSKQFTPATEDIVNLLWKHRATNLLNKEARENVAKDIQALVGKVGKLAQGEKQ
jgi:hypothetical protein